MQYGPLPTPHQAMGWGAPQPPMAFAEGDLVVFAKGSPLPPYCVRCGQPAATALQRRLVWHPTWVTLTVLLSPLVYVIVAAATRHEARVAIPLCAEHARRRRRAIGYGIGGAAASVVLVALAVGEALPAAHVLTAVAVGVLGVFVSLIVAARGAATLAPTFIDAALVRVRGAGPGFLRGLAPSPWPRR